MKPKDALITVYQNSGDVPADSENIPWPSRGCSNLKAYTAEALRQWSLHHPVQCQWTEGWNLWLSPVTSDFFLCFAYLDQKQEPVFLATSFKTTLQSKKINQKPKYPPYNIYIFNAFS